MVDKTLILRKLSTLDEYLKQIGEYAFITVQAYADDWKTQRIVERTLQMMALIILSATKCRGEPVCSPFTWADTQVCPYKQYRRWPKR